MLFLRSTRSDKSLQQPCPRANAAFEKKAATYVENMLYKSAFHTIPNLQQSNVADCTDSTNSAAEDPFRKHQKAVTRRTSIPKAREGLRSRPTKNSYKPVRSFYKCST
eukprot:6492267-Amphidinium_carterae.1